MPNTSSELTRFARKLASLHPLADAEMAAILDLPYAPRSLEPASYLVREGEPPRKTCSIILSGFAFRQKLMVDGSRQIVSLHIPAEPLDLQHLFLECADHNVQALTPLVTAEVDRAALQSLALTRPAIGQALWISTLVEASIFREWVANVGRRDARGRLAHLMCEFKVRMDAAGLAPDGRYELPMTQEQIGDATGLTSVHVNRTLRSLREEGLIYRDRRYLTFADWDRIRDVAAFSALYLHLDQVNRAA